MPVTNVRPGRAVMILLLAPAVAAPAPRVAVGCPAPLPATAAWPAGEGAFAAPRPAFASSQVALPPSLPQPVAPDGTLDPDVDRILTRLEERHIDDVRARVRWTITDAIDQTESTRLGEVWYRQEQPAAKFLVEFDTRIVGGRRHRLAEKHMFDGRWYTELQSESKTFTRRELRRADQIGNPYSLSDGVFPLPFGQKKADILAEFEVARRAAEAGDPPDADCLRLTPRPGTRIGENHVWIDFWISRSGPHAGLPVKVKLAKKEGTGRVSQFVTVEFSDVRINSGFSSAKFVLDAPAGYHVTEEPLPPPDADGRDAAPDASPPPTP